MTSVVVALPEPRATELVAELNLEGVAAVAAPAGGPAVFPDGCRAIIVPAARDVLTPEFVTACDRAGVRIVPLGGRETRALGRFGLAAALPSTASGWEIAATLLDEPAALEPDPDVRSPRVIAVWGPQGAPGRSTVAIQLAVELARRGRRTALIDADTVAPSMALLLGLGDESPGIAAACRRAEMGALDDAELTRLAIPLTTSGGTIDVLTGVGRPGRWAEVSSARLQAALTASRTWAEESVVDVSGAFDADDEATFDIAGPRRHAATVTALAEADLVLAVVAADPLGIGRFVRDNAELRRIASGARVRVIVNKVRPGPLGLDARGQIRATLDRFAGVTDVAFLPFDQRATDAALLHARPIADVAPRSSLVSAVRRLAAELDREGGGGATVGSSRGSSRGARRLLRGRGAPEA
ncbi:P-loop NTPase [Microbacterium sp. 1.5R]|uniref:AAA family ATPase n=1 Tax=Microbacterium sp. 1.5R TaxID=1916917 RepID=UPI0011A51B99|nr:P-loop NTPase [Microbacterium sp. 1.5R]